MLAYTVIKQLNKQILITCSDGETLCTDKWDDVTNFLLAPCGEFAVTWQIDEFVDIITSLLPKALVRQLENSGRVYTPDNRKLFYSMGRTFCINEQAFFGLSRYSDERIGDATKLLELAQNVIRAYEKLGIKQVKGLSSPVNVYSQILDNLDFPRACDLPDSALPMIDACAKVMNREWRQVYQLGHWQSNEITDYDLRSAYPSIMAELPDLRDAVFFDSDSMPQTYSWGILEGNLTINKPISPFICQPKNCYGVGTWPDLITTDQLWFLNRYEVGSFEMAHGNFFLLPERPRLPFKDTMATLYQAREDSNPLMNKIAKGISVGIGGKLAEIYENDNGQGLKLGANCNPIYALMKNSRCMVKVASFIYHNNLTPISVLVDGVLALERLPIVNKNKMGTWKMNEPNPALVLSIEFQWMTDKHPANMYYQDIIEKIFTNPNQSVYGDVDFNLINYNLHFPKLPKNGKDLMEHKFLSNPIEVNSK